MSTLRCLFLVLLLGFALIPLTGCVVVGAITGSVLAEPEMKSDLEPFEPGTKAHLKLHDQWKRRVLFTGVDELPSDEYGVLFKQTRHSNPELGTLPQLGETIGIACQEIDQMYRGRFDGFVGYGLIRMTLGIGSGQQMECPVNNILVTQNLERRQFQGIDYINWAKRGLLPSRTIIKLEGDSGIERYNAAEIEAIHLRVRHKRVVLGALIGLGIDIIAVLALRAYCGGPCFEGGFD